MTPKRFEYIAHLIHGHNWNEPLAKDLGVCRTTIWRWMKKGEIPPRMSARLSVLFTKHIKRLSNEKKRGI